MTLTDSSTRASARTTRRGVSTLVGLAVVAVLVVVTAAALDHATALGRGGLVRVTFGYPFDWLAQNRTASDPPFPATLSPASPWENPTSVALGRLLVDVLVVYAVLVVGWFVGRSAMRRIRAAAA